MSDTAPPSRRGALTVSELREKARFIRTETVRLTKVAGAGHYSSVFSCAELMATLYYDELRIEPTEPRHPRRDRFVMGKGHAAIGLYPVLADLGYYPPEELDTFTRLGSAFGDHPDMKKIPGIDFSSGSLGHALSVGVGIALGGRLHSFDYRTWALLGDGELAEGQIWEAAMSASHYRLGNLVALVDNNQLSIDGFTQDVMGTGPIDERFAAFGWQVHRVDGHDLESVISVFRSLDEADPQKPQCIIADTVKGKGVARMELSTDWHVGNLVGEDYDAVMNELMEGVI